jgi:peptide/nickel transport system substrate-binding protein
MGSRMKSRVRRRRSAVGLIGFAFVALALTGSTAIASSGPDSVRWSTATAHKCLVATGSGDPAFVRNFNPYVQGLPTSSFVRGGMYEPLIITTPAGGGREYKWLAQSYAWSKDGKTLTLQVRRNVKWSDGKPLTAADVVYTLTAGKQDKTMDIVGAYREGSNIASVSQKGTHQVVIKLKSKDSQFVAVNLNAVFVVPKHVLSKVADINKWTNPNPVGSGPFTKVARFNAQVYVLNKNPNYWKPGRPKIACLQYIQATSNDAALLQIRSGQADWTHNFVPNVEKAYIAKDPKHFHAFYDNTAYAQSLMFDTQKYPYSLVPFRQAVSMAIDRTKVWKLGEYGYSPPVDAIGLNYLFPSWITDAKVKSDAKRLATYNSSAAKKLLTDNGFKYQGDKLYDPKGDRVSFQIHVISGWSDWVASLQIISKNLQDIGIDASVKLEPDWGSWYPNATSTKFVTLLWQIAATGSPYGYFFNNMHENTYLPSGQDAVNTGNFAHFKDTNATKLLNQWKATLDVKAQKRIATQVQRLWLQKLPIIPLFVGTQWSTYSTKYFHCFPTPRNHYARPIFNNYPDNIVTLTTICPGGRAENTPIQ